MPKRPDLSAGHRRRLRAAAGLVLSTLGLLAAAGAAQTPTPPATPPAPAQDTARPRLTADLLKPFKYRPIGPANQSGRVTAIAVPEKLGSKTMYVSFASGGVFKTTNAGTTWSAVFEDQGLASIGDVAVMPGNANIVWVGTGERNSLRSNGWGDGVYRSADGGKTWKHVGLKDTRQTGRIALHPTDTSIAYVAALGHLWGAHPDRGIYKTTDAGKTWSKVLFVNDTTGFVDLKMDPSNPDVLYAAGWHRLRWGGGRMEGAGAGSGIWKTTDGGRTWKELTEPSLKNGLPTEALGRIGLAVHPKNPKVVYAVIQAARGATRPDVSPFGGLFRSDDAGATWTRVNDLSAIPDYYYNEVWLDPADANKVWLAATFLMHSKDGGRTFAQFDLGNQVHVDHHALWLDPADSQHMVLGNDGGIYVSWDGGENWDHHEQPTGQFYEVDVDTTKAPYHVCGGLQDNGVWCGPSRTREQAGITSADWYTVYGGDGFRSAVAPDSPQVRFAEYQFGNLARWDVNEWRYTPIVPHPEDAGVESGYEFRFDWDAPFIISQHDPTVLYFGGNHLFKLTHRGRDWRILGPDMTRLNRRSPEPDVGYTSYRALHSIAESPLDPKVLWTGSDDGLIWVSTDGGGSWQNVTAGIPDPAPQRCWVAEIEASRFDRGTAYVAYDCHNRDDYRPWVYRTTDSGRTWLNITGNLPDDGGSYVIREDPVNRNLLFVGTEKGVWLSIQGGSDWIRLKNNLPTVAVRDMDVVLRDRELVVGTFGRSVYLLDLMPLEELSDSLLARDAHLFAVRGARRYNKRDTYQSYADRFYTAPNPPDGAVITYYLRRDQGKDVSLVIRRQGGGPVLAEPAGNQPPRGRDRDRGRRDAQRDATPPAMPPAGANVAAGAAAGDQPPREGEEVITLTGPGRPGLHQVTWNLRASKPRPRELGGPTSREELLNVLPGTYTVSLKIGDRTLTQTIVVEEGWVERTPGRVR